MIESLKLLAYKTDPAITELVNWILDQDAAFSAVRDHQKKPFRTHIRFARVKPLAYLVAGSCERTLSETVLEIVFTSWLADQNAAAEALIKTLVQRWPDKAAALYARMRLIQNFEQAYEELTEAFAGQPRSFFNQLWACVEYDEALKQYVYRSALIANPLQEDTAVIPLGKTLDLRWIDLLTGQRNVEKGLFKKTTVTVYGAEDPLGSSVLVHLADPENELLRQKLSDYFDQRRQTAGHLYFKQVYGLPLKEELLAYLKHSAFGPGQMAMMTRAFCRPREAVPVLNELQDDWKKKRPNASCGSSMCWKVRSRNVKKARMNNGKSEISTATGGDLVSEGTGYVNRQRTISSSARLEHVAPFRLHLYLRRAQRQVRDHAEIYRQPALSRNRDRDAGHRPGSAFDRRAGYGEVVVKRASVRGRSTAIRQK